MGITAVTHPLMVGSVVLTVAVVLVVVAFVAVAVLCVEGDLLAVTVVVAAVPPSTVICRVVVAEVTVVGSSNKSIPLSVAVPIDCRKLVRLVEVIFTA